MLSRLRAGFWWTAIYHVEVKGRPNCPAYSMSGMSPGRCLWDATTQLTEQQQVMDSEWGVLRSMFAVLFGKQRGWLSTSIQQHWPAEWPPTCQTLADVKAGMFPPRQAAACHWNRPIITILFPFSMTYLLSLTPLSSSQVLMWMHKGWLHVLCNGKYLSKVSFLQPFPLPFRAGHLFVI